MCVRGSKNRPSFSSILVKLEEVTKVFKEKMFSLAWELPVKIFGQRALTVKGEFVQKVGWRKEEGGKK